MKTTGRRERTVNPDGKKRKKRNRYTVKLSLMMMATVTMMMMLVIRKLKMRNFGTIARVFNPGARFHVCRLFNFCETVGPRNFATDLACEC